MLFLSLCCCLYGTGCNVLSAPVLLHNSPVECLLFTNLEVADVDQLMSDGFWFRAVLQFWGKWGSECATVLTGTFVYCLMTSYLHAQCFLSLSCFMRIVVSQVCISAQLLDFARPTRSLLSQDVMAHLARSTTQSSDVKNLNCVPPFIPLPSLWALEGHWFQP